MNQLKDSLINFGISEPVIIYTFTWVCDANDSDIQPVLTELLNLINSDKYQKINTDVTIIDNGGITRYEYTVKISNIFEIREINKLIYQIRLEQLTIGLRIMDTEYFDHPELITNFETCIRGYVKKYLRTDVDQFIETIYSDFSYTSNDENL